MTAKPNDVGELVAFYAPYAWFAIVWTVSLAGVGIAAWLVRGSDSQLVRGAARAVERRDPATIVAVAALAAFAIAYAALVIYHEDLVGLDYAQLTARQFVGVPIWPDNGRFFPLALQEYNGLSLIGRTATIYHSFSIAELGIVLLCVFRMLEDLPVWYRCAALALLMVIPSVLDSFFGLVLPERDMLLWLGIWIVGYLWYLRTRARGAFAITLVAAQCFLYYKETAFVLVGGFAALRIAALVWTTRGAPTAKSAVDRAREHALELAHLTLCVVFLAVYYLAVARHVRASYVDSRGLAGSVSALLRYLHSDMVFTVFVAAALWQAARTLSRRRAIDAFWDPLAGASIVYAMAYVKLGLVRAYYLAPTDFIGVVYLARSIPWRQWRVAVAVASAAVFVLAVRDDAETIVRRKQFVESNRALETFLAGYSRTHSGALRLFFPQVGGFQLMELSSFLQYKGLRPAADGTLGSESFQIESPHHFPGDICHPSQQFRCFYAAAPSAGELIVIAPGEDADLPAGGRATAVFQYEAGASIVDRLLRSLIPDRSSDVAIRVSVYLAS